MNVFTALPYKPIVLGRQGENKVVTLQFPIKRWIEAFGNGTFSLVHQRETDVAPYPVVTTSDAEYVYWQVTSSDILFSTTGIGQAELILTVGDHIAKSEIFETISAPALGQTTSPPEPWQAWVDEVLEARDEVLDRVPDYTGKNGKYLHVKSDGSATEWADIDVGSSDFDELTNRPSYNGTTMTHATAIPEVKTATWDAKYAKPSGGIPKTDLASDVQTSLGKADTALQEHQSLSAYRTSAEQDVIDATKGTYSKPDGGIPSTDMTSAVQTSLGKADTALQEHQSLSAYRTSSAQDVIDATKEVASNKVTSIDAQSTDAQYPSAKLLYDKLSEQSSVIANKADASVVTTGLNARYTKTESDNRYLLKTPTTWEDINQAVLLGYGPQIFPVGYEFTIPHTEMGNSAWVVRAHDYDPLGTELGTSHNMLIELKYAFGGGGNQTYVGIQFDASEALYYAENGLSAGAYCFTVRNQNWYSADNGVTYYFTLANAVPSGGQIRLSMAHNQSLEGKFADVYANGASSTRIERATLSATAISGATDLGETTGAANCNHMQRIIFGSNNYYQSGCRQWLNSDDATVEYLQKTKWDVISSCCQRVGFMNGFGDSFVSAIRTQKLPCRTNNVFEVDSLDGTTFTTVTVYNIEDKFFLLSRPEIFGDWDSTTLKDGTLLAYYNGVTADERKLYDKNGTIRYKWIRSPGPNYGFTERIVYTSGVVDYSHASLSYGVAPACIIGNP